MNDITISKNMAVVEFRGGICIATGNAPDDPKKNNILILGDADILVPPGTRLEKYKKYKGSQADKIFPRHIELRFKYAESIDVVIDSLKKIQKILPNYKPKTDKTKKDNKQ